MKLLIIEDEAKTARELQQIATELRPDVEVTGSVPSVKTALDWLGNNPAPDLIISDIQLSDGLSFDIFRQTSISVPVIFCTAFDEYAIRAFETLGIDYLLKPVEEEKLAQSFAKYDALKKLSPATDYGPKWAALADQLYPKYKSSLLVHFQDKIIPVKVSDIAFIYSVGGTVCVHTTERQKHYITYPLDELEPMLNPHDFFRANRQFIVHRNAILSAEHFFTRRLALKLNTDTPEVIVISKVKASALLAWLEGA